ncbi:mechanosensitive ion channel domain-containing protein [uncultured Thalassospira sp.]|uniref:Mechanosensitive ion channel n=2 Tax=Thalassospiraceae TaxID=2844866 RepID=A0A8I1M7P5_9PROT|nr:mechanosensitive ion channel domain-containing protein [uncultured Thalassospira sp.]MBN8196742.1 mechanosensitive ion channel [Thalassospira povalilytica]HAY48103.1 mechanosensitive ion channel protein MscS [Thalassospira sp.]
MEQFTNPDQYAKWLEQAINWLSANVLLIPILIQIVACVAVIIPALLLRSRLEKLLARLQKWKPFLQYAGFRRFANVLPDLAFPLLLVVFVWLLDAIAVQAGYRHNVIRLIASLLNAWIVIRLAAAIVNDPVWSRTIAAVAWGLAALNIVGWLDPTIEILDGLAMQVGEFRVSVYGIIKAVLSLAVLLWVASFASRLFEQRIQKVHRLTPSVQVLMAKLLKLVLLSVAVLFALSTIGVDLTALAVFGGAVGVGIGLGLQRIVANLISGVILLLDRSIKPGDVIAIGETFGWIQSLGARYTAVRTRDGTEFLIPNEDLITTQVENWSHSDVKLRLKIPVGISYNCDPHFAIKLCNEAAAKCQRVLENPGPNTLLRGFGDNSVDLEIRFWIDDPQNGRGNIISEILLNVWDAFKEHDIEIPFPQRDLHLRSGDAPIKIEMSSPQSPPQTPKPDGASQDA